MPRQYLMTYVPARKGWMKKYRGQMYSISCKQLGAPPSEKGSGLAANEWWEQKQTELDDAATPPAPSVEDMTEAQAMALLGRYSTAQLLNMVQQAHAAQTLLSLVEQAAGADPSMNPLTAEQLEVVREKIKAGEIRLTDARYLADVPAFQGMLHGAKEALSGGAPLGRSVGEHVEQWLANLRVSVGVRALSAGRYGSYERHIRRFRDWIGAETPIDEITSRKVEEYWAWLGVQVAEQKFSTPTAKLSLMTAKQFINRLASELELIPFPGSLRSKRLKFSDGAKKIPTWTVEEVRNALDVAGQVSERNKLFLMLMLNCGMYQSDIADLRPDEVDWREGTVKRKRSKTGERSGNVPEVTYKLWPETFALLNKHRAKRGDRALASSDGKPLVAHWVENGRERRYDLVSSSFCHVWPRLGWRKPLKELRKTSATLLAGHPQYKFYAQYFLAQAPETIADRHYVRPADQEFFEALDWLGHQYGW